MLSKLCECASGVLPLYLSWRCYPSREHPYLCPSGQRGVILQMMMPLRNLAWPPHQNYLLSRDALTLAWCSGMVSQNILCILVSCVNFQRTRGGLFSEEGINVWNWTESRRQMLKHSIWTCPYIITPPTFHLLNHLQQVFIPGKTKSSSLEQTEILPVKV